MDALQSLKTKKAPSALDLAKAVLQGDYATPAELFSTSWENTKEKLKNFYEEKVKPTVEEKIIPGVSNAISSVDPKVQVAAYDAVSHYSFSKDVRDQHATSNQNKLDAKDSPLDAAINGGGWRTNTGFIENQNVIGAGWDKISYGINTMDKAGCGIFATYNTLIALKQDVSSKDLVEIISEYEESGNALGGLIGTSPLAVKRYFTKRGYPNKLEYDSSKPTLNALGEDKTYSAFIGLALNDKSDIRQGGHYVSISREEATNSQATQDSSKSSDKSYIFNVHNAGDYTDKDRGYTLRDHTTLHSAVHYSTDLSSMCVIAVGALKLK